MTDQHTDGPTPSPVLDPAALERMTADIGDVGTVAAVADVYLAQLGSRLAELRDSVGTDPATCKRTAHSLKSASAVLGLRQMAELCLQLELAAESDPVRSAGLVEAVAAAAGPAERELGAWRAGV